MSEELSFATVNQINQYFHASVPFLGNLYGRWLNEKDYEDIRDYQTPIERRLPENFKFIKMTRRPFGFQFSVGPHVIAITVNSRNTSWKCIK